MRRDSFKTLRQGDFGIARPPRFFGTPGVPGAEAAPRTGPVRSTPIPFTLVANAPAYNIAAANPARVGLMLQNKDPTNTLFFNFGANATLETFQCSPGQVILLDFICPTDAIYVFAAFNVSGMYAEFANV